MDIIVLSINLLVDIEDDIQTICQKINAVYKYLCYNFNIKNLYVIEWTEIKGDIDLVDKISDMYIHNAITLEEALSMEVPYLPEKLDFNGLVNTFNDFVEMLIHSRYNLVSKN